MYPVLFELGPLTIHSFGAMMALGFMVAATLASREYRRLGGDSDAMFNLLVYVFLGGLAGSKVFSLFNDLPAFFADPITQIVSGSGFVWYGGLIFGALTAWVLHRRYEISIESLLGCTAFALPIGQAIGRIGCHVAGDGDWGIVTEVPWGVAYTNAVVGWNYPEGVRVHPTPLYEFAAYMTVFFIVWSMRTRDVPRTTMFATYLVLASIARFAVEFIRINPQVAFGLTQAQIIAIVLFAIGLAMLARDRAAAPQPQGAQ